MKSASFTHVTRALMRFASFVLLGLAAACATPPGSAGNGASLASAADGANALIDRWSNAYTSNEPEAIVQCYKRDAILLGTVSPIMSVGSEQIRTYFNAVKGTGNKNSITERKTIVLDDKAVVVTGFYVFTRMKDGQGTPSPSRFTMLVVKDDDGQWRIAHHHSSPHVQPKS